MNRLSFFIGQETTTDCGTCDVCRSRAQGSAGLQYTRRKIIDFIEEKGGDYSIEEIVAEFDNPSKKYSADYLRLLRELIDDGTVPMYRP